MFFNTAGQCMKLSLQLLVGFAVKSLNFATTNQSVLPPTNEVVGR